MKGIAVILLILAIVVGGCIVISDFSLFSLTIFTTVKSYMVSLIFLDGILFALSAILFFVASIPKRKKSRELWRKFEELKAGGNGTDFENFLKELLTLCGWKVENPTASTNASDQGIDLILDRKIAVQAKNYGPDHSTGNKAVQEVIAGMAFWKKERREYKHLKYGVVVTTSHFTRDAIKLAQNSGVILKDVNDIAKCLRKPKKDWILKSSNKNEKTKRSALDDIHTNA